MAIVAGIDFGTLSVRVSLFDSEHGRLGTGRAGYPITRIRENPDHATQSHLDQLAALEGAMRSALQNAGIQGSVVDAIAIATTGSTVIPVDDQLRPLDDYYLWCDHRSQDEAAQITRVARDQGLAALAWSGGSYSSEMGFSKLLHWLRNNPSKRNKLAAVLENCDMIVATLIGCQDLSSLPRSACGLGHKWLWNDKLGGLPEEKFLTAVDPLLSGAHHWLAGRIGSSNQVAGTLSTRWAGRLGLRAGIPIPYAALDAHWDAIGAGITEGDIVNVIGTSTCIMAVVSSPKPIPGVCGVAQGSIDPEFAGVEAGLSAAGDIFEAIARRSGRTVAGLSESLLSMKPGQTGLLRLVWDNGDRTLLTNPSLGGVTLGWNLTHQPEDELLAAIEGTAYHTRIILERMVEHGVPVQRLINGGGIPQRDPVLNQVYADILNKPILVPSKDVTGCGAAVFAFLAAGVFSTVHEAQQALSPGYHVVSPRAAAAESYEPLFQLYRRLYFSLGDPKSAPLKLGEILPSLRRFAAESRSLPVFSSPPSKHESSR